MYIHNDNKKKEMRKKILFGIMNSAKIKKKNMEYTYAKIDYKYQLKRSQTTYHHNISTTY